MDNQFYGQWECLSDGYRYIRKGERVYPTVISDYYIGIWIQGGVVMYLKENFRECINDYDPKQAGDREDDI